MDLDQVGANALYAPGKTPMPGVGYLLDEGRAVALAERLQREGDLPTLGVTRLVVFLTERCNMRCDYCLSVHHPMPRWRDDDVLRLLTTQAAAGCAHVQWTGGEASLHPRVVDLVSVSSSLGMNNSTSTNGSAPLARYRDLVAAGMTRFYVSLDTLDAARFDEMTGSRGLLPRVLDTLRLLVDLREAGRDVFVTVNTLLRADRVEALLADDGRRLRATLRWLRETGVDDFKFVPDSAEHGGAFFRDDAQRRAFTTVCTEEVPARHGMFHHRLATIAAGGHGFPDAAHRRCHQCVDDRAYDARGAYGCVIQLREGGEPIYLHGEARDEQRRKLGAFRMTDRTADPICREHCFDLYQALNSATDELLP